MGNCTIFGNSAIAKANPIRYRGYYYDEDTGLYYCNARYYSPKWRRFISPDDTAYLDPESVNGLNQYCYCGNDPVNRIDPSGYASEWLQGFAVGLAILGTVLAVGAITVLTMGVGTAVMGASMAGAVIHGAAVGTLIGAGAGVLAGGIIGGATSNWSAEGILTGMGIGFGGGALLGAVIGGSIGAMQYINAVNQWGSVNNITSKQNMIRHFEKHVVQEGHTYLGRNAIQYTKNAKHFYDANKAIMKLTNSGNYVIRAKFLGHSAGGFFDLNGVIFSFF